MTAATARAVFDRWCVTYHIRVRWICRLTDGPTSNWTLRRVAIYPFTFGDVEERIAEAAHEVAHICAGKCPGVSPHQPRVLTSMECVTCEVTATRVAEWLVRRAGLDWTRPMHDRLRRGLRSYRRTPAPAAAVQALTTLASDQRYAARQQARVTRELQIAEIHRIAAEPRYRRPWETKYAYIRQLAKEARRYGNT